MDKKRAAIISIIVALVIIILALLFFFMSPPTSVNPFGEELTVSNLHQFTLGKPTNKEALQIAQHNLFLIVQKNLDYTIASNSIDDVIVRDTSFSQTNNNGVHHVSFIVDIESIQQSYQINYGWPNSDNITLQEYSIFISCLPSDQLIYGDFDCKDILYTETQNVDPITRYLPYNTFGWSLSLTTRNNQLIIIAPITLSSADTRNQTAEQAVNYYKSAINTWFSSHDLNPADYTIEYTINY